MDIPFDYCINDPRLTKEFKGITISGYKRTDVVNVFYNSLFNSELENTCRWCVELHSTGLIKPILDKLELLYFKNVNISNPYFIFYYYQRKERLNELLGKFPKKSVIYSRNNQEIRNLLCELTSIVCLSKKNIVFETKSLPKLGKDFSNINLIRSKIKAKDTKKIYSYLSDKDPSEVKLALNEIINILYSFDCNFNKVIYWYLWLKKITQIKLKGNKKTDFRFKCEPYDIKGIGDNYKTEWTWPLWKIILDVLKNSPDNVNKFVKKLYSEFKNQYKGYSNKEKHYQLMLSIYVITTSLNWKINIRQQDFKIIQACGNINYLYKNIENSLIKNLSMKQIQKRKTYMKDNFIDIRNKEKKRMENIVLVEDTSTGTLVEHKITKDDQLEKKNEKSRYKSEAFMNFTPKIKPKTFEQIDSMNSKITDYFDDNSTKMIEINQTNRKREKKTHTLSKLDLIF